MSSRYAVPAVDVACGWLAVARYARSLGAGAAHIHAGNAAGGSHLTPAVQLPLSLPAFVFSYLLRVCCGGGLFRVWDSLYATCDASVAMMHGQSLSAPVLRFERLQQARRQLAAASAEIRHIDAAADFEGVDSSFMQRTAQRRSAVGAGAAARL